MKTTVEISDALPESARELAAARSTTLRRIIEEGLIKVIDSSDRQPRYRMRDASFGGKGPSPNESWEKIRDMIYKGRGAAKARTRGPSRGRA
jgi:hypothetical protein